MADQEQNKTQMLNEMNKHIGNGIETNISLNANKAFNPKNVAILSDGSHMPSTTQFNTSSDIAPIELPDISTIHLHKQKVYKAFISKGFYVPCIREATLEYFRDVASGKKKVKVENVKFVIDTPKFHEITTRAMVDQIKDQKNIREYLPEYAEKHVPDRKFLFNIINTVTNGRLQDLIEKAYRFRYSSYEESRKNQENKKNAFKSAQPEEILKDPNNIHMLRPSKKIKKEKKEPKKYERGETLKLIQDPQ